MLIIDFKSSTRKALYQGFLKGLGAPVMLFGSFQMPTIDISEVVIPRSSPADDWANVGNDLRRAMRIYGEADSAK